MKLIISVEGNIGSGKSTLLNKMKEKNMSAYFIQEPVDEWNTIIDEHGETILGQFYKDQEKYSFPFQMMAYITRLKKIQESLNTDNDVFIMERSLQTDTEIFEKMLYDDKKLNTYEHQIYLKWVSCFSNTLNANKTIYIRVDPEISYQRIKERNRNGEDTISLEYLKKCHDYHETMISKINPKQLLILNGNENIYENENVLNKWFDAICNFIIQK